MSSREIAKETGNVLKVSKGEDVELNFAENFLLNKGK